VNIYYDNAGGAPAHGIVNRYAAGIASGQLTVDKINETQDNLLNWQGWEEAVAARKQYEMYPGDPGEFTTIPPQENELAHDFRANFDNISSGKAVLYVFIAFKFRDPSMAPNVIGVTEDCFWFSGGNFARHNCGRGRTFLESK
jgi:hypothetical protein